MHSIFDREFEPLTFGDSAKHASGAVRNTVNPVLWAYGRVNANSVPISGHRICLMLLTGVSNLAKVCRCFVEILTMLDAFQT